jgi:ABC-type antimicrobial peptide transport system permease subunit
VLALVVGEGIRLVAVGLVLGLAAAAALTRGLASLLFEVTPTDPLTFAAVAALFIGVAVVAVAVPARRAARVDPLVALRYE